MEWDAFLFNTAAFVAGVIVLDIGADKFIDHTVIVGRRLGIPQTLIALLTAGAEYEELAVVIAAILQHQTPLALGNVMGSTISNILGAFSLGLIFHSGGGPIDFDGSAKVYTLFLFVVTTLFVALAFFGRLDRTVGVGLIALFAVYIVSIGYAIYRGVVSPPEDSDSDSDSDSDRGRESDSDGEEGEEEEEGNERLAASETSHLLGSDSGLDRHCQPRHSLIYHICQLLLGFILLSISGFILSHSSSTIAESLNLSGTVVGITILSFATTLPEKFVAIMSGSRGHSGIMVASTAGSNIFLLTLCMGIVAVSGGISGGHDTADTFVLFELGVTWLSSALLLAVVVLGLGRITGVALLAAYVVFLGLEFSVYRR